MDEDIVVGRVADAPANHADCKGKGGYGSDKILIAD